MSLSVESFQLRPIRQGDSLKQLSLGGSVYTPLKVFLKKTAFNFHQIHIARTYVLVENESLPQVWGYITLMNSEITLSKHQKPQDMYASSNYDIFPAVKIARLAIDKKLQGKGLGKRITEWAISLVKDNIAPYVGCRFLVVDAKQTSVIFYQKIGFELFTVENPKDGQSYLMFLDLYKIN